MQRRTYPPPSPLAFEALATGLPVSVVMPTIPPRCQPDRPFNTIDRAIASVWAQTQLPAGGIHVAVDTDRRGAAETRQAALDQVETEWVAFLDDDDTWYPHHLRTLWVLAQETGADYVWSWFDGNSPFDSHRGRQMDPHNPHHTTMNVMVKTELAKAVGFRVHPEAGPEWPGEDWDFIQRCCTELIRRYGDDAARHFAHTPKVTWTYHVHGNNTSGLPTRW